MKIMSVHMMKSRIKAVVRRVFTRKSFSANEIMVVVSVNAKSLPKREKLISKLRKVSDRIVSIVLNINTKRNNLVRYGGKL